VSVALYVLGSFAVATAIIALIMRSAIRGLKRGMAPIANINELMRSVGAELGLTFHPDGEGYGSLTGRIDGVPIEARVRNAYYEYWIQLFAQTTKDVVVAAKEHFDCKASYKDGWLMLEPKTVPIRAGRYIHFVPSQPAELRAWLEDLAAFIRSKTA